jgi:putative ABC transport system permease protein
MGTTTSEGPWRTVVGVVKDVRQNDFIAEPKMQMYFTYRQLRSLMPNALIVRTAVDPLSLATSVRNAIWSVDKDQTVANVDSMEHIVAGAVARQRFSMLLLGIFAGLALVLAAVGIYSVMSYSVAQRTHEIGIRMALGARSGAVVGMVMRQTLFLAGAGLALGIGGAIAGTRVLSRFLFNVTPTDPVTLAGVALVLAAVALAAGAIPARRASRIDPLVSLRRDGD